MAETVPKDRDPENGQYTRAVSDEDLVAFLETNSGGSTAEVADHFEYERPTAYRRLKELEDSGAVTAREVGNSLLWVVDDA